MAHGTREPPFPDACRTGRRFTWSGSADSVHEFDVDGCMHLASHVQGRWCATWPGMVQDINCDGTITDRDGTEHRVRWWSSQEGI